MLAKRVLSAAVLIPIVALAVYLGGYYLFALVLVAGVLAEIEFLQMGRPRGLSPSFFLGLTLALLFIVDAQWPQLNLLPVGLAALTLVGAGALVFRHNAPGTLAGWALAVASGLYVGCLASYFVRLRAVELGWQWLAVALVGTWLCDSGAYFVGVKWGRHKLVPTISPNKSWEGLVGAVATGVVTVPLLAYWLVALPWIWGVLLGLLLVVFSTLGDLAESAFKRQVGVKDSGNLIPGHGGVLDRIDSLLFVVPMVYYGQQIIQALTL